MNVYFIGICGIGMSGIAQAFRQLGHNVAGSDRQSDPGGANSELISHFKNNGIRIFPQNGTYSDEFIPDCVVISTAIEEDNPDLACSGKIKKIHRSEALKILQNETGKNSVAVTGCSGKTSVSSWIAETLANLSSDPTAVIGGKSILFSQDGSLGNFHGGKGGHFIFEADESDKSLLNYSPDYAVILNTGTDHYPIEEQNRVFAKFASSAKKGVVIASDIFSIIREKIPPRLEVRVFGNTESSSDFRVVKYSPAHGMHKKAQALITCGTVEKIIRLPSPGIHNAMNAAAVLAILTMLKIPGNIIEAMEQFQGVKRRFQILGRNINGSIIIDDYAHNPDKIASCIKAAKEICPGKLFFIFQPHGYGPLKFMKDALGEKIKLLLKKDDLFIMLPVYYAGGSSSFSPKSEDVISEFKEKDIVNCVFCPNKESAEKLLSKTKSDDCIIIAGARDEQLSIWGKTLCAPPCFYAVNIQRPTAEAAVLSK
jgi:UDP-N-acetylmuramate--alanine ligase